MKKMRQRGGKKKKERKAKTDADSRPGETKPVGGAFHSTCDLVESSLGTS